MLQDSTEILPCSCFPFGLAHGVLETVYTRAEYEPLKLKVDLYHPIPRVP